MADYIKSKGIAGKKLSQEVNKEAYEKSIKRLKQELEETSGFLKSANELLMEQETKTEATRKEHKKKKEELAGFQEEIASSLLIIETNKKKIKEQNKSYSTEKEKFEKELAVLKETLTEKKEELENFEAGNKERLDYIERLKKDTSSLEDFYLKTLSKVNSANKEIVDITDALNEAKSIIENANQIKVEQEQVKNELAKWEKRCDIRQRSLEREYAHKLGIKLKKF